MARPFADVATDRVLINERAAVAHSPTNSGMLSSWSQS
jgi:hypothetical protein